MTTRIKLRRDTAANWTTTNPVLALGEPGLETDTRKVKYGDGVTAWNLLDYSVSAESDSNFSHSFNDGVNDNVWRMVTVQGAKEFTFETQGYKDFALTLTAGQVANIGDGYITITAADVPEMDAVWLNYQRENNVYFYLQSEWDQNNLNSYFNYMENPSEGVYQLFPSQPFAEGDKVVIKYYTEGTTYQHSNYDTWGTFLPDVSETTATNTVTISLNEYTWLGSGAGSAREALLNSAYFGKHAIYFQTDSNNNGDQRNITNVVDNEDGTVTLTFDGAAQQSKTTEEVSFSFQAVDTKADDGYLTIPKSAAPTFASDCIYGYMTGTETNKYTGGAQRSGYLTINGGEPISFYWYQNGDGITQYSLNMQSNVWYNQGDVIAVTYYKSTTEFELSIWHPNTASSNWNNGYRWFDWKDDLGQEYAPGVGNGVVGGNGQYYMRTYREAIGNWSAQSRTLASQFGWSGLGNYQRTPYDPYTNDSVSDWGKDTDNCYPMYSFDEYGIVFNGTSTYYDKSVTYKVRIMYKMELMIGEDESYGWFDC